MLRARSLTARLVLTAVTLVAVVAVLIGTATTVAMRASLTDQLDDEVRASLDRAAQAPGPVFDVDPFDPAPPFDSPDGDGRGDGAPPDVRGQGVGTLTAYLYDDYEPGLGDVLVDDGDATQRVPLSADVLEDLDEVRTDGRVRGVRVSGLGEYRVAATTNDGGRTVVAGLPVDDVEDAVAELVAWEVALVLLGIGVSAVAGVVVVRRQLRPLREVAATAHDVAGVPLSEGDVARTARVPDELTDERTEVGQVGAALNTLLDHVEEALRARHASEQQVRQFVADASHELRTPLATIAGYAELTRRTRAEDETAALRQALGKVEVEAARMSSLVEDLLLLARLDAGRPLERAPVDLTRLVLEDVADARVVAPDHRWVIDVPDEPVVVEGDEQRLHQTLVNLLANARRHTPAGTTVTVALTSMAAGAELVVRDDGPGISDELVGHVFERFTRGDSARTRASGSVGLGLSVVHAIVAAHGGTVDVASRPGATAFTLRLP